MNFPDCAAELTLASGGSRRPRIAIVHEWLVTFAGSEKVVAEMIRVFPDADLFAVVDFLDPTGRAELSGKIAVPTFIQKLPGVRRFYRHYLPLMPLAVEQLDLSAYDLVISSSHAVAKGVLTGPDQLHISYVHSPIRYAWDLQHQYLRESGLNRGPKAWLARWLLHRIRLWDYRTAAGVDHFVSNSRFIGRRIKKVYGRNADVIHPPVDVEAFEFSEEKEDYYLAASRLVPYKRMDLIVRAFAHMPDRKLVVIGDGPEMGKLRSLATSNVMLLGYQPFSELKRHMQRAKAFVFAAEEDFGITPVEAQACGTPVIAFGKGGALETVVDSDDRQRATGVWFPDQTEEAIVDAITRFESAPGRISAAVCRAHAETFSSRRFWEAFAAYVGARWSEFASAAQMTGVGSPSPAVRTGEACA